jgi:hypothetical protein
MPITTGGLVNYNQKFIDLAEHYDQFLANRARKHPNIWFDRIPKGALTNYEGLVRKTNIFHGGLGEQAGLQNWSPIQVSRKPGGADPGFDACAYDPKTFTYAVESIQYTGYRTSWQSEPICINDIRFLHEGREQARLITSFMGYITQSVWENWNREQYAYQAVKNGHAFILTEGGIEYDAQVNRFSYDPYTLDADGDTVITFPSSLKLSTLNWTFFDWWQDYLGDQCPEAAPANLDGLPVFGLMIHKRDFDKMIMGNPDMREDLRYHKASVLFDDYRKFSEFKGWALIHDQRQMRFKVKKVASGTVTAKRVLPMREGRTGTIGRIPEANPEYNNAELAVGIVFMKDVIQNLIPTPISNAGGGMIFGPAPGYNGTFQWINEYDRELNPLKEVGYFFARFEAFPKPLMFSSDCIVFLYRRCPQTWTTECEVNTIPQGAAIEDAVKLAANATADDLDSTNKTLVVKLETVLACGVGSAVTLASVGGGDQTSAIIAEDALAPTYKLAFATAPSSHSNYTTSTTVTCG